MNTILIVENNRNQLSLYEQELRLEGYKTITALDGKDALDKAQERPLDLIIMDINLPKMDGIETMGRILSKNKGIPIIVNTAYSNYKDKFMSWIASAYVVKSSDLSELKRKIREILSNKV